MNNARLHAASPARTGFPFEVSDPDSTQADDNIEVGIDNYLESLRMVMTVKRFGPAERMRIVQLLEKSRHYNLTTPHYTEADVARIEKDPDCFAIQARLSDAYDDKGMVCIVVCRRQLDSWYIDTWLMRSRVMGRKVESAVLEVLCEQAKRRGVSQLIGTYIPSQHNSLAEDHYARLGFMPVDVRDDGSTVWQLQIDQRMRKASPIELRCIALPPNVAEAAHAS